MKKFIYKILSFSVILCCITIVCLLMPPTPRLLHSSIYGKIKKDSLLIHIDSPRIVFLGGSNLPFGLDSKKIRDSLSLNPVNTGIMHTLGLKIIIDNYLKKSKKNDIVIISPEYEHFFDDFMNGNESTLYYASVNQSNPFQSLDYYQLKSIIPHVPKYIFKKIDPREYWGFSVSPFFNSDSFNEFGDLQTHWNMKPKPFSSDKSVGDEFNQDVIEFLLNFEQIISKNNISLYISPPPFNKSAAMNNSKQIRMVERKLKEAGLTIIGEFENYIFHDSLFFNSSYHLTKDGTELRTKMFISEFREKINN